MLLPDADGLLQDPTHFCARGVAPANLTRYPVPGNDLGIAQWAYDHRPEGRAQHRHAGQCRGDLPAVECHAPLHRRARHCVRRTRARSKSRSRCICSNRSSTRPRSRWSACNLSQGAQAASMEVESEKLRNVLLSVDLARLPHAAGKHHRRGIDPARRRFREPRRGTPTRAAALAARRGAASASPGRQSARPDPSVVRPGAAQARMGRARRTDRRGAAPVTATRSPASTSRSTCPQICRWCSATKS